MITQSPDKYLMTVNQNEVVGAWLRRKSSMQFMTGGARPCEEKES